MAIRLEDVTTYKPGRQDNMTREKAERLGLRAGTDVISFPAEKTAIHRPIPFFLRSFATLRQNVINRAMIADRVRHYRVYVKHDKKGAEVKSREGIVLELWKHGFVVQLPHWKEFFHYNLLRGQESGERVEIVGMRNHKS